MKSWIAAIFGGLLLIGVLLSARQQLEADREAEVTARQLETAERSGALRTGRSESGSSSRSDLSSSDSSTRTPLNVDSGPSESPPEEEVVLAEEKQKRIWDNEHTTFELETYFGKAFQKAIRDRDRKAIKSFFLDGAKVDYMPSEGGEVDRAATVTETRAGLANKSADVDQLADHLIELISSVKEVQRSKLRVLELETEDGLNWTSKILLQFVAFESEPQPFVVESHHTLQLTFSSDDEIKAHRIISGWRDDSRSERRSDSVLMREVTEEAGLAKMPFPDNWNLGASSRSQYWFHVAVADFNNDDYPDIAAATIAGRVFLLRSERGEKFVDVTEEMRLHSGQDQVMRGLATWIDIDNDNWTDLVLGNRLYRNIEGKSFQDITEQSGLRLAHEPMSASVADYDCDGLLDLYVLYQNDPNSGVPARKPWIGDSETGAQNHLWRNEGGGRFRNATEESGAGGGARHSFAATWHLLDDDPYPDLYIANDFGANVHLRNLGDGTFADVSREAETADFATSMGVCSGDLNNDGRPEIYVANMYSKMGRRIIANVSDADYPEGVFEQIQGSCAGNRLYTQSGNDSKAFSEISELAGVNEVGWAYAPAMADFDSDGLLDIYATTGFMSFERKKPDG